MDFRPFDSDHTRGQPTVKSIVLLDGRDAKEDQGENWESVLDHDIDADLYSRYFGELYGVMR